MTIAIKARMMQFTAGPQENLFFACPLHTDKLNYAVPNFFIDHKDPIVDVAEDDEIECDFCREG